MAQGPGRTNQAAQNETTHAFVADAEHRGRFLDAKGEPFGHLTLAVLPIAAHGLVSRNLASPVAASCRLQLFSRDTKRIANKLTRSMIGETHPWNESYRGGCPKSTATRLIRFCGGCAVVLQGSAAVRLATHSFEEIAPDKQPLVTEWVVQYSTTSRNQPLDEPTVAHRLPNRKRKSPRRGFGIGQGSSDKFTVTRRRQSVRMQKKQLGCGSGLRSRIELSSSTPRCCDHLNSGRMGQLDGSVLAPAVDHDDLLWPPLENRLQGCGQLRGFIERGKPSAAASLGLCFWRPNSGPSPQRAV